MHARSIFPVLLSLGGVFAIMVPMLNRSANMTEPTTVSDPSGANTISYSLNDNALIGDDSVQAEVVHEDDLFYLNLWIGASRKNRITFVLKEEIITPGVYELDDPDKRYLSLVFDQMRCPYTSDEYFTGTLKIDAYNQERRFIAGSFEFVASADDCEELVLVKDGRFDATF